MRLDKEALAQIANKKNEKDEERQRAEQTAKEEVFPLLRHRPKKQQPRQTMRLFQPVLSLFMPRR